MVWFNVNPAKSQTVYERIVVVIRTAPQPFPMLPSQGMCTQAQCLYTISGSGKSLVI